MEYSSGALLLASNSERRRLDSMQRGFLHEIGYVDTEAFVEFNFAPPSLRRAIGILGFIHKRILGLCHPALCQALPFHTNPGYGHLKVLCTYMETVNASWALYFRSLWQYVYIYNRLPQGLVDTPSVKTFQAKHTHLTKERAKNNDSNWRDAFQSCEDVIRNLH